MSKNVIDVTVVNQGTGFFIITGQTKAGRTWVNTRVQDGENGVAYCDDSRAARDIFYGAQSEGLTADAWRVQ